jgi:hypothetical protein
MSNQAIEIHDSTLESLTCDAGHVVLGFSAAYIHKSDGRPAIGAGTGWVQRAVLRIHGEIADGSLTKLPCDLMDGCLTLGGEQSGILIPAPLRFSGDTELVLTSEFAESVRICGNQIVLELVGEPKYVEQYPG